MAELITELSDDDIRTEWPASPVRSQGDDDATDTTGGDEDATDDGAADAADATDPADTSDDDDGDADATDA